MSKVLTIFIFITALFGDSMIPISKVELHRFSKKLELNAKVVQLSNSKQAIMSQLKGHIEEYFVKVGAKIEKGDKIALIRSMELSQMSAEFISLKKELYIVDKNYRTSFNLYKKGLTSMLELNQHKIKRDNISAKLSSIKSKLQTLGIDTKDLKSASAEYIVYAHSDGILSSFLLPLHSIVDTNEQIVSIVKDEAYYLKIYLPLKYAARVKVGDRVVVDEPSNTPVVTKVTQILPKVDEKTQQVVLLASFDKKPSIFIGSFIPVMLFLGDKREYLAVKKSALSFYNNEWVIFVPKEDEKHHDNEHHEDEKEDEDHEHKEVPYEARVVKVITDDGLYVAVKGLKEGEEYVSDRSYYIKSMLLKSALGGHGH